MDRLRIESWMREVRALWRRVLGIGSRGQVFYIGGSDVLPPPLEPCEEARLLQEYAAGSQDARNILIERNLRLVTRIWALTRLVAGGGSKPTATRASLTVVARRCRRIRSAAGAAPP